MTGFAPDKVERVLLNLLTNALRRTPPDGAVAVRIEPDADSVRVTVEDTGEGLGQAAERRRFDRFLRADGRFQLHIHAGSRPRKARKIARFADGVATGAPPVLQVRENSTMPTCHPEYSRGRPDPALSARSGQSRDG